MRAWQTSGGIRPALLGPARGVVQRAAVRGWQDLPAPGEAEHFGGGDHRGRVRGCRAFGRAEDFVAAMDDLARQCAGAGALREAAAPALFAVVTAAGFDPADDEQRIGLFEDFDVDVGGIEHRQGLGGLHFAVS
ncbi:hypothetical protein EMIT0111MI5_300029 [Burkholderia sp. IT-111MI5]